MWNQNKKRPIVEIVRFDVHNWLGREDSNLRMPDPKTGALPLGYAPAGISETDAETTDTHLKVHHLTIFTA